jgi:hypothetical protein
MLSTIRNLEQSKVMPALSRFVREKSPVQTMSVEREFNRVNARKRINASLVNAFCVHSIAILMAQYNHTAVGLPATHPKTVSWVFFKDAMEAVRKSISKFEADDEACGNARAKTKQVVDQVGIEGYTEEDREKDILSLSRCGYFDARNSLREKAAGRNKHIKNRKDEE